YGSERGRAYNYSWSFRHVETRLFRSVSLDEGPGPEASTREVDLCLLIGFAGKLELFSTSHGSTPRTYLPSVAKTGDPEGSAGKPRAQALGSGFRLQRALKGRRREVLSSLRISLHQEPSLQYRCERLL